MDWNEDAFCHFREISFTKSFHFSASLRENHQIFCLRKNFAKIYPFFWEKQLIFSGCLEHFLPSYTYFRENLAKCHQNIFSKWSLYIFHRLLTIFLPFIVIKFRKSQHLLILANFFRNFRMFSQANRKIGSKKNFVSTLVSTLSFGKKESRMSHIGTRVQ
jgi:hypothetical protein